MLRRWTALLAISVLSLACGGDGGTAGDTPDAGDPPPADAQMYADAAPSVVTMFVHSDTTLFTINDATFALTVVGEFSAPGNDRMTDLAVTPDGQIYTISNTKLYSVNRENAAVVEVGDVGGTSNVGMTFLVDGRLLATDQQGGVRKVDPKNGDVDEVGSFGGGYATAGDLVAIADGRMFAISDEGPNGDEWDNNVLLTVDPETGAFVEPIGQIGFGGVFGAAVANGNVYAFTRDGDIIEIDPDTGTGTLVKSYPAVSFWGAGVTPRAVID